MIDIAGLLATALLLATLVVLEVRHAGQDPGRPPSSKFIRRMLGLKALSAIWVVYLIFFLPRVLRLLT